MKIAGCPISIVSFLLGAFAIILLAHLGWILFGVLVAVLFYVVVIKPPHSASGCESSARSEKKE